MMGHQTQPSTLDSIPIMRGGNGGSFMIGNERLPNFQSRIKCMYVSPSTPDNDVARHQLNPPGHVFIPYGERHNMSTK